MEIRSLRAENATLQRGMEDSTSDDVSEVATTQPARNRNIGEMSPDPRQYAKVAQPQPDTNSPRTTHPHYARWGRKKQPVQFETTQTTIRDLAREELRSLMARAGLGPIQSIANTTSAKTMANNSIHTEAISPSSPPVPDDMKEALTGSTPGGTAQPGRNLPYSTPGETAGGNVQETMIQLQQLVDLKAEKERLTREVAILTSRFQGITHVKEEREKLEKAVS